MQDNTRRKGCLKQKIMPAATPKPRLVPQVPKIKKIHLTDLQQTITVCRTKDKNRRKIVRKTILL
jgi:hypothetical protein